MDYFTKQTWKTIQQHIKAINQKIQEYMKNRYVHKWITSIVVLFQINQKTNVNYVYTADVFDKKKFS